MLTTKLMKMLRRLFQNPYEGSKDILSIAPLFEEEGEEVVGHCQATVERVASSSGSDNALR